MVTMGVRMRLTVHKIRSLPDGRHADAGTRGLYVRVAGSHARYEFRFSRNGVRTVIAIGLVAEMTLDAARLRAVELRAAVRRGEDPAAAARAARQEAAARAVTFDDLVTDYLEAHRSAWKNAKHAAQWASTLKTYASPVIGTMPAASTTSADVLRCVQPIWATKHETASRLRGRIERVLDVAVARGLIATNPAAWSTMRALLPKQDAASRVEERHHAAMPWREVPAFMLELRQRDGLGARALEVLVHSACRSGEVRGMAWSEIEARTWTIPAARMKAGRQHVVPLTDRLLEVLQAVPRTHGLVFPSSKGTPLSDMTLTAVLKRMGRGDVTAHGFRSSFRDWSAEATTFEREVCEAALAHKLPDRVEAAYLRTDYLDRRRELMAAWSAFIGGAA
jgi:integrase